MTVRRSMAYVGVVALACLPLTWLARAIRDAREDARSGNCVGGLKQLGLALMNYASEYGCCPPAYVADGLGDRSTTSIEFARDVPRQGALREKLASRNDREIWVLLAENRRCVTFPREGRSPRAKSRRR